MPSPHEVPVSLGAHSYAVRIGSGLLNGIGARLADLALGTKVAVIADEAVAALYAEPILASLRAAGKEPFLATLPSGEASKALANVSPLLSLLAKNGLNRKDAVVALGGGVTGDLAGFVAATYLRGVPFVQVPTTLLAMVDSSVGGKTGVNLPEGKNLVGAFYQPRLVVADLDTLSTLPAREIAAGMAEVIKYGLIADPALFALLRKGPAGLDLAALVRRCVEIKAEVVADDEFETTGRRAILNFGHTLGHAIENASGYGVLLHGEAVAIGMRAAAHLSRRKAGLSDAAVAEIEAAIAAHGLPLHAPGLDREKIGRALKLDKKAEAGVNRWILLPEIGKTVVTADVTAADVDALLDLVSAPPA